MIEVQTPAFLYLDTETTGLDDQDQIWQLSWILERANGSEIARWNALIGHSRAPSPWVLANTPYVSKWTDPIAVPSTLAVEVERIRHAAFSNGLSPKKDVYLVGAVPSFDDYRIRRIVMPQWHYHLIDIEVLIMGAFALDVPPTLAELEGLTGVKNEKPHDAMADAQHVRDLMHWLRKSNSAVRT